MGLRGKRAMFTIVTETDRLQTQAKFSKIGDAAKEADADSDWARPTVIAACNATLMVNYNFP